MIPSCGCPDECVHGHNSTRIEQPREERDGYRQALLWISSRPATTEMEQAMVLHAMDALGEAGMAIE